MAISFSVVKCYNTRKKKTMLRMDNGGIYRFIWKQIR